MTLNAKSVFLKVLKAYFAFAFLNVLYKCLRIVREASRAKKLWKNLPGSDSEPTGGEVVKNSKRMPEWILDVVNKSEDKNAAIYKFPYVQPTILCNTAESIQWMLKDEFENVTKAKLTEPITQLLTQFLGNGIFVVRHGNKFKEDDGYWHKERKTSSRIFTQKNMSGIFQETFEEKSNKVIKRIDKFLSHSAGKQLDMQDIFFSFTMDSIEKFFMGTEVDSVSGGMSNYGKNFDKAHYHMMAFAFSNLHVEILNRTIMPYPFGTLTGARGTMSTLLTKFVGLFDHNYLEFKKAISELDKHIYKYVEITKKDPNLKNRKDIVASFLNGKEEMSNERIRDIVLNLTIAGRDTTACIMSWLFFELTQNPQVQQKLFKEIDETFAGKSPSLEDLSPDNVPYLNGVLYETLRLHPAVPWDGKRVSKDIVYKDGTIIPEGTLLLFAPYVMGRNPKVYEEPNKFKPERWIPFKLPSLYEFPVFQAGPRFCLGKDLAQFETKLLTVKLLQRFRFEMDPEEAKKVSYSINLTSSIVNSEDKTSTNLWLKPIKR